jgi:hypothetical protein
MTDKEKTMKNVLLAASLVFIPPMPVDFTMDGFEGIMCDSDMECEEATGYPYDLAMQPDAPKYPTLVGHGCKGAVGPIYAFKIEHLPLCREVASMDWDWKEKLETVR